ncbi:stigma-specific STIG1-like protein 1 [Cornus florida]|uniref:stigma-specific STIG1-like protein 1 n=1 Tax=Cornus florida TaxID=4283 RepID=UPI0028A15FB3|nr:stigma-specific STIG1-like protein 1 [Cornus florida]
MKCLKVFLTLVMLMALATTLLATPAEEEVFIDDDEENAQTETIDVPLPESDEVLPTSLRGTGRFLAQTRRVTMTCSKFPRVCRAKGSPGPDCCKKKCVNVKADRLNCGMCAKKCKYSEICCKGVCVNPLSNKKHCGGCNTKCKKGSSCVYGMCSYA